MALRNEKQRVFYCSHESEKSDEIKRAMTPEEYLDFLEQLFDLFDPPIELSLPDFDAKGPHVHGTVEMFGAAQRGEAFCFLWASRNSGAGGAAR